MPAGNATYIKQLTASLLLRWSTKADKAGCALVAALAFGDSEGFEDDYAVRSSERLAMDEFPNGNSAAWAICVDTSSQATTSQPENVNDSPYVAKIRQEADSTSERVVACILLSQHVWCFEKNAAAVTAGRITLSACKTKYRGMPGLMKGLFEMIEGRCIDRGDVLIGVNGIPAYYRKKGYEYGVSFGKGLITQFGDLPLPAEPLPELFSPSSAQHSAQSIFKSVFREEYSLRPAEVQDAARLRELHEAPRYSAQQWVAYQDTELSDYIEWLSGARPPPFDDPATSHHLDLPMREPVSVLEQLQSDGDKKIVAAMIIHPSKNTRQVVASRVLFDTTANLAVVARELVLRTVQAVLIFWRSVVAQAGVPKEIHGDLNSEPSSLLWFLPPNHPISLHLVGQGLASPLVSDSLVLREDWSIKVPNMTLFLSGIRAALDARLDAARHVLGSAFSLDLKIGCYDLKYHGSIVKIVNCKIRHISRIQWSGAHLDRGHIGFGTEDGLSILATYESLVALLMGYKSRAEIHRNAPDFQLAPQAVVVCDILFPKSLPSFPAYL